MDKRALSLKERLKFRNLLRGPKSEDYFLRERLINSRERKLQISMNFKNLIFVSTLCLLV